MKRNNIIILSVILALGLLTIARIDGNRWLFVKGAPEMVTTFCHLDEDNLQKIRTRLVGFQNQAMRTLAFACRQLEDGEQVDAAHLSEDSGLTFQGMAAISDPIRTDVPDAVKACVDAGIQVKIVTGDTSATATEIARQIGAWTADTPAEAQITGTDFAALSDEEAYKRVAVLKVMSRARPSDKQRLVNLLQKRGEVVAVTGFVNIIARVCSLMQASMRSRMANL